MRISILCGLIFYSGVCLSQIPPSGRDNQDGRSEQTPPGTGGPVPASNTARNGEPLVLLDNYQPRMTSNVLRFIAQIQMRSLENAITIQAQLNDLAYSQTPLIPDPRSVGNSGSRFKRQAPVPTDISDGDLVDFLGGNTNNEIPTSPQQLSPGVGNPSVGISPDGPPNRLRVPFPSGITPPRFNPSSQPTPGNAANPYLVNEPAANQGSPPRYLRGPEETPTFRLNPSSDTGVDQEASVNLRPTLIRIHPPRPPTTGGQQTSGMGPQPPRLPNPNGLQPPRPPSPQLGTPQRARLPTVNGLPSLGVQPPRQGHPQSPLPAVSGGPLPAGAQIIQQPRLPINSGPSSVGVQPPIQNSPRLPLSVGPSPVGGQQSRLPPTGVQPPRQGASQSPRLPTRQGPPQFPLPSNRNGLPPLRAQQPPLNNRADQPIPSGGFQRPIPVRNPTGIQDPFQGPGVQRRPVPSRNNLPNTPNFVNRPNLLNNDRVINNPVWRLPLYRYPVRGSRNSNISFPGPTYVPQIVNWNDPRYTPNNGNNYNSYRPVNSPRPVDWFDQYDRELDSIGDQGQNQYRRQYQPFAPNMRYPYPYNPENSNRYSYDWGNLGGYQAPSPTQYPPSPNRFENYPFYGAGANYRPTSQPYVNPGVGSNRPYDAPPYTGLREPSPSYLQGIGGSGAQAAGNLRPQTGTPLPRQGIPVSPPYSQANRNPTGMGGSNAVPRSLGQPPALRAVAGEEEHDEPYQNVIRNIARYRNLIPTLRNDSPREPSYVKALAVIRSFGPGEAFVYNGYIVQNFYTYGDYELAKAHFRALPNVNITYLDTDAYSGYTGTIQNYKVTLCEACGIGQRYPVMEIVGLSKVYPGVLKRFLYVPSYDQSEIPLVNPSPTPGTQPSMPPPA